MKPVLKKSRNGEWYMQLISSNGREQWRTSETYKRRAGAIKAFFALQKIKFDVVFPKLK